MDAGARGRPALRPRRRRRRLRRVRVARRHRGGAAGRRLPHPLRRADRGQRGERQPRPARPPRGAGRPHRHAERSCCASTPAASTTSGCGSPRRCAGWPAARSSSTSCDEGVHSGAASGVVPEHVPHRPPAARPHRGRHHRRDPPAPSCTSTSPTDRLRQAADTAADTAPLRRPTAPSSPVPAPSSDDPVEQLLNRTWRPTLSRRRRRRPARRPTQGRQRAAAVHLARSSRSGCRRRAIADAALGRGRRRAHRRPALRRPRHLRAAGRPARAGTRRRSRRGWRTSLRARPRRPTFGEPARAFGEGGTIPFMGMLGERFPDAQFVITGVLGPGQQRPRPERVPPPADAPSGSPPRWPWCWTTTPAGSG